MSGDSLRVMIVRGRSTVTSVAQRLDLVRAPSRRRAPRAAASRTGRSRSTARRGRAALRRATQPVGEFRRRVRAPRSSRWTGVRCREGGGAHRRSPEQKENTVDKASDRARQDRRGDRCDAEFNEFEHVLPRCAHCARGYRDARRATPQSGMSEVYPALPAAGSERAARRGAAAAVAPGAWRSPPTCARSSWRWSRRRPSSAALYYRPPRRAAIRLAHRIHRARRRRASLVRASRRCSTPSASRAPPTRPRRSRAS